MSRHIVVVTLPVAPPNSNSISPFFFLRFASASFAPSLCCSMACSAAVTEKTANSATPLFKSAFKNLVSLFTNPITFITKPTFAAVCVVYGLTYVTANSITSLCEFSAKDPSFYKLGGTTVVNMSAGILKDKYFAEKFSGKPVTKFPLSSWSLFCLRDTMTIAAGFTLPPLVSAEIQKSKIFGSNLSPSVADKVAQVATPLSAQFLLTPIHLLALDCYNNKTATVAQRVSTIKSIYIDTTTIRMGRVLCAYGIAGVTNTALRKQLRETYLSM